MTEPNVIATVHAYGEVELGRASDKPSGDTTEKED